MNGEFCEVDRSDKKLLEIELLNIIKNALGISYPVRRIKLDIGLYDVAHVTVESIVRDKNGKKLAQVLTEEFDLQKKSEKVDDLLPE